MGLHETIYTALSPLVAGEVYPDIAPEAAPVPRITYQRIGGLPVVTLSGAADLRNSRVQIDVWAVTRLQAEQISQAVRGVMDTGIQFSEAGPSLSLDFASSEYSSQTTATQYKAVPVTEPQDSYEAETRLYRTSQDFSVWHY